MKVSERVNTARQDFSLKNALLRLNRDLDSVIRKIDRKFFDMISLRHSHTINIESLSNVQIAVLFLEDRHFFVHRGFEFRAPLRLLKRLVLRKRAGAISTIDQQLVRIYTGKYERTLSRKIRETLLAFLINSHCSKAEILHAYLHDCYLGYNLEGIEVASQFLFSRSANSLPPEEAAFIASLLARPLPKKVFLTIKEERQFRDITPDYIIRIGGLKQLEWSKNISNRYKYALRMLPSMPSSLRMR